MRDTDGATTMALGEEGDDPGDGATTMALGEEGDDPSDDWSVDTSDVDAALEDAFTQVDTALTDFETSLDADLDSALHEVPVELDDWGDTPL